MSPLIAARGQMAVSLAFHIVFASLGVGLPLLMFIAEYLAWRRKDLNWYILAKRWSKAFGILYAIGAVSGTILSFELGLLWPRFMAFAGPIFGLAFYIEATAFFIEAIFLGLYLYSWEKVRPVVHLLFCVPLVVGGLASALFVTVANAWMNAPTGFTLTNGKPTNIDPIQALLNPQAPMEAFHMVLAAYEATGFAVATVYAVAMLRGHRDGYTRKGLLVGTVLGTVTAPLQIWVGDVTAKIIAQTQPAKLAAMEGLFKTTRYAPLTIYGWPDPASGHVYFGIQISDLLSLLAFDDIGHPVRGLDSFPGFMRPDTQIIHPLFDTMVGIGFLMAGVVALFWWAYVRHRAQWANSKPLLWLMAATGPLTFMALEFGWAVTELGRQPYIIYGVMLVANGVTTAPGLDVSFPIFFILYVLLGVAMAVFLLKLAAEPHETPPPAMKLGEIPAEVSEREQHEDDATRLVGGPIA